MTQVAEGLWEATDGKPSRPTVGGTEGRVLWGAVFQKSYRELSRARTLFVPRNRKMVSVFLYWKMVQIPTHFLFHFQSYRGGS